MAPSMRNRTWIYAIVGCALLAGLVVSLAGDLEPPGPPSPTMENLIRADDLPLDITVSGSYALAENISTSGGGITISVSNVTIDLRGHTLEGGIGDGIASNGLLKNLVVKNGTIRGWGNDGIDFSNWTTQNSRVVDVLSEGNLGIGIRVSSGNFVSGCQANGNTGEGILASNGGGTIVDTTVSSNGGGGIFAGSGWSIRNCAATLNTGLGISAGLGASVVGCIARDNDGDGFLLGNACSITSSVAFSNGDSAGDDGIVATQGGVLIVDCTSYGNFEDGIEVTSGAVIRGNNVRSNGGAGINATGSGSRIEENNTVLNTGDGINVNPATGNFILRNSAQGNTGIAFDIAAGNSYGAIVAGTAAFSNSNSWANYTY